MKAELSNRAVYKPNDNVTVTVKNTPVIDEPTGAMGYMADVTVKTRVPFVDNELRFKTVDEIAEFMANVEYDEPQMRLL